MGSVKLELVPQVVTKCLSHAIKYSQSQVYGLLLVDRTAEVGSGSKAIKCIDVFPMSHTRFLAPMLHIAEVLFEHSGYSDEIAEKSESFIDLKSQSQSDLDFGSTDEISDNYFNWDGSTRIEANPSSIFTQSLNKLSIESQFKGNLFDNTKPIAIYTTQESSINFKPNVLKDFTKFDKLPLVTIDLTANSVMAMFKVQADAGLEIAFAGLDKLPKDLVEILETRQYRNIRDLDTHLDIFGPEKLN